VREVQGDCGFQVRQLLAESIRQARKRQYHGRSEMVLCLRKRRAARFDIISAEGEPMENLSGVVQHLKKELERAEKEVLRFGAALAALGSAHSSGRSTLSAAARKKISLAQKKRWAIARKQSTPAAPAKRTMSASARKKIAAAQRKRWAKVWAQAKKAA
jgi:hypothetical protein